MKKTLIAAGLLTAFGVAHAESSVTLYGGLNVAITKKGSEGITLKAQENRYASHIGFAGKEDLGHGLSAIFRLESELSPDTGAGTYGSDKQQFGFNRHAFVGLITPVGAFRFGRSTTPLVNMWVAGNFAEGRGIGEFTGGLTGVGLRSTQPEAGIRWNNAFFYDVQKNGFTAGLAVTTKGSQSIVPTNTSNIYSTAPVTVDSLFGPITVLPTGSILAPQTAPVDNEGARGSKPAYGAYARYEGKSGRWGYKIGGAYQVDNGSTYAASTNNKNAPAEAKNTWGIGANLSYGPVSLSAGYAKVKIDNTGVANNLVFVGTTPVPTAALRKASSKTLFVSLGYDITPRDHIYASYGRYKRSNSYDFIPSTSTLGALFGSLSGQGELSGTQYSIGYEHRLSKRTVIYANARKVTNLKNTCTSKLSNGFPVPISYQAYCATSVALVNTVLSTEKGYSYDLGISHTF